MLIPAKVQSVVKAAAKESTRYALLGVHLERVKGKCVATATDGRVLLSATWDDEQARAYFPGDRDVVKTDEFSALVGAEHWEKAFKMVPRLRRDPGNVKHLLCDEHAANGTLKLSARGPKPAQLEELSIEGRFPNWRDIIPPYSDADTVTIGVNPLRMAQIMSAIAKCATTDKYPTVRLIVPKNPRLPIIIEADDGEGVTAVGVVMPVRLNGKERE